MKRFRIKNETKNINIMYIPYTHFLLLSSITLSYPTESTAVNIASDQFSKDETSKNVTIELKMLS